MRQRTRRDDLGTQETGAREKEYRDGEQEKGDQGTTDRRAGQQNTWSGMPQYRKTLGRRGEEQDIGDGTHYKDDRTQERSTGDRAFQKR